MKALTLLKPDGILIDMQEMPHMRWLEVHSGDQVISVGCLRDEVDFEDIKLGHQALARAVEDGYFIVKEERVLDGYTYAESLEELRDAFPGTVVDDAQASRVAEVIDPVEGHNKVAMRESVRLVSLSPGSKV
ncbi:MAG: hypothetical protein ACE5M4_10720 [Anaerolineales bacterium]